MGKAKKLRKIEKELSHLFHLEFNYLLSQALELLKWFIQSICPQVELQIWGGQLFSVMSSRIKTQTNDNGNPFVLMEERKLGMYFTKEMLCLDLNDGSSLPLRKRQEGCFRQKMSVRQWQGVDSSCGWRRREVKGGGRGRL